MAIKFAWDPAKADSNKVKHRVTFALASRVFDDRARVGVDVSRNADGEERRKAIGSVEGKLYSVVYTIRPPSIWIISARRTNPKEDRQYGNLRP